MRQNLFARFVPWSFKQQNLAISGEHATSCHCTLERYMMTAYIQASTLASALVPYFLSSVHSIFGVLSLVDLRRTYVCSLLWWPRTRWAAIGEKHWAPGNGPECHLMRRPLCAHQLCICSFQRALTVWPRHTRQIQARPKQPWARCSVFIPPPVSRGHYAWGLFEMLDYVQRDIECNKAS
jgi:hypothetical protein